jgi:uncharacterized membrane protein
VKGMRAYSYGPSQSIMCILMILGLVNIESVLYAQAFQGIGVLYILANHSRWSIVKGMRAYSYGSIICILMILGLVNIMSVLLAQAFQGIGVLYILAIHSR